MASKRGGIFSVDFSYARCLLDIKHGIFESAVPAYLLSYVPIFLHLIRMYLY